jgi:hypothetical protein
VRSKEQGYEDLLAAVRQEQLNTAMAAVALATGDSLVLFKVSLSQKVQLFPPSSLPCLNRYSLFILLSFPLLNLMQG